VERNGIYRRCMTLQISYTTWRVGSRDQRCLMTTSSCVAYLILPFCESHRRWLSHCLYAAWWRCLFFFLECSVKYTQSHMLSSFFIQLCYTNRPLLAYLRPAPWFFFRLWRFINFILTYLLMMICIQTHDRNQV